jgi:hypothetical protein
LSRWFEEGILKTLRSELHPMDEARHLADRELKRLIRVGYRTRRRQAMRLHLLTCSTCRERYDALVAVEFGVRVACRSGLGPADLDREGIWRRSLDRLNPGGVGESLLRHAAIAALALSVVALAIVLPHVLIDRERAAPVAVSPSLVRGSLLDDVQAQLTPELLVAELKRYEGYPPHRAAVYTIGLLNRYGVPLGSTELAFSSADVHTTQPGDTWESVARETLGDPALWPIIVLFNLEWTEAGEFVPVGTVLRVPRISEEGAS